LLLGKSSVDGGHWGCNGSIVENQVALLACSRLIRDWPHLLQTPHHIRGHGSGVGCHLRVGVALTFAVLLRRRGRGVRLELHLLILLLLLHRFIVSLSKINALFNNL
jgi:hypothetical protein